MVKSKAIKTGEKLRGNQYGRIYQHSAKDRYYAVQTGETIHGMYEGEGLMLTRNGAKLAALLIDEGYDPEEVCNSNVDDCAVTVRRVFNPGESIARWVECYGDKVSKP